MSASSEKPIVDPQIQERIQTGQTVEVIIAMRNSRVQELQEEISAKEFESVEEKRNAFYKIMNDHMQATQQDLVALLEAEKSLNPFLEYSQMWTTNQVIVKNVGSAVMEKLAERGDIASIRASGIVHLHDN